MLRPAHLLRNERLAAYLSENPYLLAVLISIAWTALGLVGHDPWKPDEAYTFGVVFHLFQSGDWIVPGLAGEAFMEKPPLAYLVAAAFGWLFSPLMALHDAARLATGAWMALVFLFIGMAGRELYGGKRGWLATLMLLGCGGLMVRAHQVITDVALLAGLAMGLHALALSARRPRLAGLWLGLGLGVSVYSTGLVEPLMLVATMLLLPAVSPHWRTRGYALTAGLALVVALPWIVLWPAALFERAPELFAQWFWTENVLRLKGIFTFQAHDEPFYFLNILPWFAWPALPFALWTLWSEGRDSMRRPEVLLPLVAFVVFLGFLSLKGEGRDVLGLPLLLPLALLATARFDKLLRGAANAFHWFSIMLFTVLVLLAWFYWMAIDFGIPEHLSRHLKDLQPAYVPGTQFLAVLVAIAFTACWFVMLFNLKRTPERPAILWAGGSTVAWALVSLLLVSYIDTGKTYRSMVSQLAQAIPSRHACIYSQSLGDAQRAMLHYFAGVFTVRLENSGPRPDCDLLIVQDNWKDPGQVGGPWEMIWEGRRPGDRQERYRLYRHNGSE